MIDFKNEKYEVGDAMQKIEDLYIKYIDDDCKLDREIGESNEEFCKLVKKYNLLEDVFDDMIDVECAEHYEKVVACRTEIEKIKMSHAFQTGFKMGLGLSEEPIGSKFTG